MNWHRRLSAAILLALTLATSARAESTYKITVALRGTGSPGKVTSAPAGISCGAKCSASFNANATVTLWISNVPAGSKFAGWGGACSGTGDCVVTMNANKSVAAKFNSLVVPTATPTSTPNPTSVPTTIPPTPTPTHVPTTIPTQSGTSGVSKLWANDGGDKVTRDEMRATKSASAVVNSVWDGGTIRVFGARNEVVAFNAILESLNGAQNVRVSLPALTGPNGFALRSATASGDALFNWTNRQIELFYVGYQQIKGLSRFSYDTYDERHIPFKLRRPWSGEGVGTGGWTDRPNHDKWYPDIAYPLEIKSGFAIARNNNQSIWADIYIPKSAPAGVYSGTLAVTDSLGTISVPVSLTVRNFTLPDSPSAKTMLYYSVENVNQRHVGTSYPSASSADGVLARQVRDRLFQMAHRHRISMIDSCPDQVGDQPCPEWVPRLNGQLFTPANGYDGPGVGVGNGVFSIGTYGGWNWQSGGQSAMNTHTNAWANWFQANAPSTEYFLYLVDESTNYPQTEQWAQWVNNNPGSGSKVMSFATISAPEAVSKVPDLDIVTSSFTNGITSTWQNAVNQVLANPNKRMWLYNGLRPASGTFATDDDGVSLRELAWGQYKKKIQRWFYWESTYYDNFQGGMGNTNVYQNAQTFGTDSKDDSVVGQTGSLYTNGEGVLFYPGTDETFPSDSPGINGPIASLRLKHWRRGIQDVDYLTMAAKVNPTLVNQIVAAAVPKALWEYGVSDPSDPTWVKTDISWSINPDAWESARAQLANIIEGK